MYQRSADIFLGVPFNIASYALLLQMVAQVTGLQPGEFVHTFGDAHIYLNHIDQVKLQLTREPFTLPKMNINPDVKNIFDFKFEDFKLVNYQSHPHIKGEISVWFDDLEINLIPEWFWLVNEFVKSPAVLEFLNIPSEEELRAEIEREKLNFKLQFGNKNG